MDSATAAMGAPLENLNGLVGDGLSCRQYIYKDAMSQPNTITHN